MSRGGDKNKGIAPGPFVPVDQEMRRIACVARNVLWSALAVHAFEVELALATKTTTAGSSSHSGRRWRKWAAGNRDSIRRWFRELEYLRLHRHDERRGCLGVGGKGKAPQWRLTELKPRGTQWRYLSLPTKDYLKWDGTPV